jgi:hypothetical protein
MSTVHDVLLCLGELAIEAGLLNSALSRTGGDAEVAEKEMFCHFSLMVQLMALGNDRRSIDPGNRELCLDDLMMLIDDEWLKTVPTIGLRFTSLGDVISHDGYCRLQKLLSLVRHRVMHQVSTPFPLSLSLILPLLLPP